MQSIDIESLLPLACAWLGEQEAQILHSGVELNDEEIAIAQRIGVQFPERVRLLQVLAMPEPAHPVLKIAMHQSGFFTSGAAGLTLSYGIFIVNASWRDLGLVAHELVHVAQYERLGGGENFLRKYLQQCLGVGYWNAPLEIEAREVSTQVLNRPRD